MKLPIAIVVCLFAATLLALPVLAAEGDAAAHYAAGRKAEEAGDFKTAFHEYEKVMDIDEEYEDVFARWEAAMELADWRDAIEGEPTADDLVIAGEIYLKFDRTEEERRCYEKAIALDPKCSAAHGHLALSHYGGGGDMTVVMKETLKFLETSPYREKLGGAIAGFEVFGLLRIVGTELGDVLKKAGTLRKGGKLIEAAALLEKTAEGEMPDAYRTLLLTEAGKMRVGKRDYAGAKKTLTAATTHAACKSTSDAHIALASIALVEGDEQLALEHLRAAVKEGSDACRTIAKYRNKAFAKLFNSSDEAVRAEAERLADPRTGDEPIRAEIQAALARAKEEGKLVLLEWYGPYCPYVMAMEEKLARPEVQAIIEENYIHVRMNQGAGHRGLTLDEEYGGVMQEHGVPCFFVLSPDGEILETQKDAPLMKNPDEEFSNSRIRAYDVDEIISFLTVSSAHRK